MSFAAPTPESLGFELIPPDPGIVNPDLALDATLAPTEDIEIEVPRPFGRTWQFDFLTGQFVKDGNLPKVVYEMDSLIVWVEKALRTARNAHPIYEPGYGMDPEPYPLIGQQVSDEGLSHFKEAIEQALLYHDRIVEVDEFSFSQDPFEEDLYVSFTVLVDTPGQMEPQQVEFKDLPVGHA